MCKIMYKMGEIKEHWKGKRRAEEWNYYFYIIKDTISNFWTLSDCLTFPLGIEHFLSFFLICEKI